MSAARERARRALDGLWFALRRGADLEVIDLHLSECDRALAQVNPDRETRRAYQQLAERAELHRALRAEGDQ